MISASALGIIAFALFVFVLLRWIVRVIAGRPRTSIVELRIDPEQFAYFKVLVNKSKEE